MKKILGLDLGTTSIGWALIEIDENGIPIRIIAMGSRIIPLNSDDQNEFSKGNAISKNQKRTEKRTQRKGYDRYQLRRSFLIEELRLKKLLPDESLIKLPKVELWKLRSKAASEQLSLPELGRILFHLNQKRGYKSSRSDANLDKKDTEYVAEVKSRHDKLKEKNQTIGQYFYEELLKEDTYRIKQQVFPRDAYIEEFDAILKTQQNFYPDILTDEFIHVVRNEIIYYQRKLKSQKGLVSVCEFEGFWTKTKEGKDIFAGPKVAPKTSPLFQICKIWETINNITLKNKHNEIFVISPEQKQEIFTYLDNNSQLSYSELFKILKLKKDDGWFGNKQLGKGLQGNLTKTQILKCFDNPPDFAHLFQFDLKILENEKETYLVDKKNGEIIETNKTKVISDDIERQPFYQLWHTIYSINDKEECANALIKRFNIPSEVANKLSSIDFTKQAFGNRSVKCMRKILPYLVEGYQYSEAASFAGYNHSDSLTKDEQLSKNLASQLKLLEKNSLRQPIVEKILNQMINLVNAIIAEYGAFGKEDEIRVELARELKQSKDERNEAYKSNTKRERENASIADEIKEEWAEHGIRASRNNIIKWRLFHEIDGEDKKIHAKCIYCGQPISLTSTLRGDEVDIEHIIPKALLFDDSQSNKTLSHRKCNTDKKNMTAYDFMQTKSDEEFNAYIERVKLLYDNRIINYTKYTKLLASHKAYLERKAKGKTTEADKKLWESFIDRQLRESQYIARKSMGILQKVCYNVWATGGSVTEFLRRTWGWNEVLMNLQLPKYRELRLTEINEYESNGQIHKKEEIKGWTKRDDHRHHAIDALVIACTKQGYIQRINTLSSQLTREEMYKEVQSTLAESREKKNLLETYIYEQKPFTTQEIETEAAKILISFKSGKKVATTGKRKIKINGRKQVVQESIIIPRGALSEDSIYGKIKTTEPQKPIKYLFENPHLIFKNQIRKLVEERLGEFEGDAKKALASLKKDPIYLDAEKIQILEYGRCYKDEYVIKYPLEGFKAKDIDSVVDIYLRKILQNRLSLFGGKEKEAFKDLEKNPVWFNEEKRIPIKTVRCFTGLSAVVPVKKDENGNDIGYVKPGNNHHIAIYIDESGKRQEHVCTFWHAVERKKYGLPIIIRNPSNIWDKVLLNPENYPESFTTKLPDDKWSFELSLQQNEMFVLGMNKEVFDMAIEQNNYTLISKYLYRTQKITNSDYVFRHHLETKLEDSEVTKLSKRYFRIKSISTLLMLNPIKVSINNLGKIITNNS